MSRVMLIFIWHFLNVKKTTIYIYMIINTKWKKNKKQKAFVKIPFLMRKKILFVLPSSSPSCSLVFNLDNSLMRQTPTHSLSCICISLVLPHSLIPSFFQPRAPLLSQSNTLAFSRSDIAPTLGLVGQLIRLTALSPPTDLMLANISNVSDSITHSATWFCWVKRRFH